MFMVCITLTYHTHSHHKCTLTHRHLQHIYPCMYDDATKYILTFTYVCIHATHTTCLYVSHSHTKYTHTAHTITHTHTTHLYKPRNTLALIQNETHPLLHMYALPFTSSYTHMITSIPSVHTHIDAHTHTFLDTHSFPHTYITHSHLHTPTVAVWHER